MNLEIEKNESYMDISNLLYALLIYITGEKGAGDIKISGLDISESDDEKSEN